MTDLTQPVAGWWLTRGAVPWVPRLDMWPWAAGHRGQGPELHNLRKADLAVRLANGQLVIVRLKQSPFVWSPSTLNSPVGPTTSNQSPYVWKGEGPAPPYWWVGDVKVYRDYGAYVDG